MRVIPSWAEFGGIHATLYYTSLDPDKGETPIARSPVRALLFLVLPNTILSPPGQLSSPSPPKNVLYYTAQLFAPHPHGLGRLRAALIARFRRTRNQ